MVPPSIIQRAATIAFAWYNHRCCGSRLQRWTISKQEMNESIDSMSDAGPAPGSETEKAAEIDKNVESAQVETLDLYGSIPDLMGDLDADEYWGIVRGNRKYDHLESGEPDIENRS